MNADPFRGPWGGKHCRDSPSQVHSQSLKKTLNVLSVIEQTLYVLSVIEKPLSGID